MCTSHSSENLNLYVSANVLSKNQAAIVQEEEGL